MFCRNMVITDLGQMAFANSIICLNLFEVPCLKAINPIALVLHLGQNKNKYLLILVEPHLRKST